MLNIKLNELDKDNLDKEIEMEEICTAVHSMKMGKAPGLGGLLVKFYVRFWGILKNRLYQLYGYCIQQKKLNPTARQGLISLLLKGTKDPKLLTNWRPLTLLNMDYNILAKILATHMKKILNKIISLQQTGFMEKRWIGVNIVKTLDVIAFANHKKKKQLIITIDFEKCFDRIAYAAIVGALTYFNFGRKFVKMVMLFYTDFQVCTRQCWI